jgi:MFS transporter, sugar porter (SP) family
LLRTDDQPAIAVSSPPVREKSLEQSGSKIIYWIAVIVSFGDLLAGYGTGVVSGALLFLRQDFHLDATLQEIAVSIALIGAVVGALGASSINDKFGRKKALLLAAFVYFIGALVTGFVPNYATYLICRVVVGIGFGAVTSIVPVYVSEVAPSNLRGKLGTLGQLAIALGIALAYGVDLFFTQLGTGWRPMFIAAAAPAVLFIIGMLFVPETPRWLGLNGRWEEARSSLKRLGRTSLMTENELTGIHQSCSFRLDKMNPWSELFRPGLRLALIVGVGLAAFQQLVGINTVIYYSPTIFQIAGFTSANTAILATSIVGIVNVVATAFASLFIDKFGRRPLLLGGTVGVILSMIVLGGIFMFHVSNAGALTLTFLFVYIISMALSFGPVFWVMCSEIFPNDVRATGSSISTLANWSANFIISVTFLTLVNTISLGGSFWLYAFFGLLALAFCLWLVPETKNRSLEDIEYYWRNNRQWPDSSSR